MRKGDENEKNLGFRSSQSPQITLTGQIATECLHTLFSQPFYEDDDFQSLVCPMYYPRTVELLKNIFNWIPVDPNDINEDRYLFLKRFSEVRRGPTVRFRLQ